MSTKVLNLNFILFFILFLFAFGTVNSHPHSRTNDFSQNISRLIRSWGESRYNFYNIITDTTLPLCDAAFNKTTACAQQVIQQRLQGIFPEEDSLERLRSLSPYEFCVNYNATR